MEVLSCPDIQYAGESNCPQQSPESKSSNHDFEEKPTLMLVEHLHERAENELLVGNLAKTQSAVEDSFNAQLPGNNQSNGRSGVHTNLGELSTLKRPRSENLEDVHNAENGLQKICCHQELQEGPMLNNDYEAKGSFLGMGFLQMEDCNERIGGCRNHTPLKVRVIQGGESDFLRNREVQNLCATVDCKENQMLEKLNKVDDYGANAKDTQRNGRNVDQSTGVLAEEPMFTDPLDSLHNEWSNNLHDPQGAKPCNSATVNFPSQDQIIEPSTSLKNSSLAMENMEDAMQDVNQQGNHIESQSTGQDGPVALWVKWRGKWQTGIRCSRADYPLSTLKAKPTHERKKYFVVFFPNTRAYSWVDMQLVRSIDELPEPLAYGTHYSWMTFVKDLTFPRRYIMQKLAVSMLDVSDQLHTEAVIESARIASSWKEFAKEASFCNNYSELGMMLLKLHKMILPDYISSNWLEHSLHSWMQQCQNAQSAETIESLTEELVDSVLWCNVEELWEAPVQPELGPEWRTWKQEVMKLFSTSHPGASGIFDKQSNEFPLNTGSHFSRKRPKLEIRRPYICVNEAGARISQDNMVKCSPRNYNGQGLIGMDICESVKVEVTGTDTPAMSRNLASKDDEIAVQGMNLSIVQASAVGTSVDGAGRMDLPNGCRNKDSPNKYRRCLAFIEAKGRQCGRWANDGDVYCCVHLGNHSVNQSSQADMPECTSVIGSRLDLMNDHRDKHSPNKYRQCLAFVEAKGRQCGRWANDGDIYCCAHLGSHYVKKPSQPELTPPLQTLMCEGTTTHGKKCKHRARSGSAFCKKHQLHRTDVPVVATSPLASSASNAKGKHGVDEMLEAVSTESVHHSNMLLEEKAASLQDNLISVAVVETSDEKTLLRNKLELDDALSTPSQVSTSDFSCCIGYGYQNNDNQCLENAKKHTLYCEKHIPNFLKRARNGKSRIISKEIFINLLKSCTSRNQKIYLHQACELLYGFMKNSLSHQKLVSQGDHMARILSEASKNLDVAEYLLKLVSSEREKIGKVWGFEEVKDKLVSSLEMSVVPALEAPEESPGSPSNTIKCKICTEKFSDDETLRTHWMEVHKKEAQWLFRGYACALCRTSFTNRKVQEAHVKEKHGIQFLEGSLLFRCMSCNSHFTYPHELWQHVLSNHSMEFRLPDSDNLCMGNDSSLKTVLHNESCVSNGTSEKDDGCRKFICRFCGLKFDLLPDLGRHHQSAHMNLSYGGHFTSRRNKHLKRSRLQHSRFKKDFGASCRFKKSTSFGMKKCFQPSSSVVSSTMRLHTQASQASCLGTLLESHCFNVAETLFTEIQRTKSRPSNMEILSIARSTCCRTHLHDFLKEKHDTLPENLYLKAAKLCSELNIQVNWHLEGFVCPKGCNPPDHSYSPSPLASILNKSVEPAMPTQDHVYNGAGEMDECHYVLSPKQFNWRPIQKTIVLCADVSFGKEPVPVACVVDDDIKDQFCTNINEASRGQNPGISMPWEGYTYVTKRLLDPSLGLDPKSSQLGCACSDIKCHPERCDHVYLFDNDYENAKDIHGNSMHGRFPYNEMGRIIVEEGCLVYECNSLCSCDKTCQNRVLQNGVQVKLEVFRTEKKVWAVRAAEAILRGTFVCEYIGEVLNDVEANLRGERYDSEGCSYLYDIDAHIDADGHFSEGKVPYVIDATKYGNVSRFINHSCSPNLVNYQVLVESMDCQLAHIGFYADRDIARGEELAYDYRYKLLPGVGWPCYCGSSHCRGRLY